MNKEELKKQVKKLLEEFGAKEIKFYDVGVDKVVVSFNWESVISFKASLPGWVYTGIQLDPTHEREYRIEFSNEHSSPAAEKSSN